MNLLSGFLRRHNRIALDTSVLIYLLDANAKYVALARQVLAWVEQPGNAAVTSTITMTELLVKPYRALEHKAVSRAYELMLGYPNLEWIAPDLGIADIAARIRAVYRLKTPDAIQAATAIHSGATGLVTNDAGFEPIPSFETLMLDRLL